MKLDQDGNNYFINSKKKFQENPINPIFVKQAFEFAYEMAFGKGFHRDHRSGGETIRNKIEIFQNTFQGKIAEIVLYELLKLQDIKVQSPDFNIHGKGIWDETDLKANEKSICVKSAAFFSNLLLLETKDWDTEGSYIPNLNLNEVTSVYDFFVLVRIQPDIKKMIAIDFKEKENLWHEIAKTLWLFDIPGYSTIKTIQYIIEHNYILPKDALLNGKAKMDAENYYLQSGDLRDLDFLYVALNEN